MKLSLKLKLIAAMFLISSCGNRMAFRVADNIKIKPQDLVITTPGVQSQQRNPDSITNTCDLNTHDVFNSNCVDKCLANQTRDTQGRCVAIPPSCNTVLNDLVAGRCLPKCLVNQYRDVSLQCRNSYCTNGASNYPTCDDCGTGQHMVAGSCESNSKVCVTQPVGTRGGYNFWTAGRWDTKCVGFSCTADYDMFADTCIQKCPAGQIHHPVAGTCILQDCSNGATNFPTCSTCRADQHMQNGLCVASRRVCLNPPANSIDGYEEWLGSSWSNCRGYRILEQKCEIPLDMSWGTKDQYNLYGCYKYMPGSVTLNPGETYTIEAAPSIARRGYGHLKIKCDATLQQLVSLEAVCTENANPRSCAAGTEFTWGGNCSARLTKTLVDSQSSFVYDTAPGYTGNASVYCRDGHLIQGDQFASDTCNP